MASSKKAARQRRIIDELNIQPSLRIAELADRLGVSTETVRRDLDELTRDGLIARTYGGAVRRNTAEPGLNERHNLLVTERQAIARVAAPLLAGSSLLMIGSGATTVHVARRIAFEMNRITVITHSFGVATVLSLNPTIQVIVTPGLYHPGEGAIHGAQTLRFLEDFRADWAVVGASGLDDEGASDALIEASEVYSMMMRRSARTMIVADSSKFGQHFAARYTTWDRVDTVVSERAPTGRLLKAMDAGGAIVRTPAPSPFPGG
ncbi:DeoR/GlpR family DNA-binding transcription regulator [Caenispirillum bisanense]|uniref:Transcriptional regulator, DeoR family n=1 Tax=Caenispirillum bisanense TaxID=414052 RepID=A0A286G9J6_9PROT|nr:DeoR/GlpR family DNA-binding transcription regulator [Caenispirillum bisanense]SOD91896.1 transcriptional regulator, DeoR family [Caenispirillum bisanense]